MLKGLGVILTLLIASPAMGSGLLYHASSITASVDIAVGGELLKQKIDAVAASTGAFLPLVGGTLSGPLYISTGPQAGYGVVIGTPAVFAGGGEYWDDLQVSVTAVNTGTLRPPTLRRFRRDLAGTSEGVYLYAFANEATASNENEVSFGTQMPHGWKRGTAVEPHLHLVVITSTNPGVSDTAVFGLEYTCDGIGTAFPTTSVILGTATLPSPYVAGYLNFPQFTPPDILSANCLYRLYRNSSSATDNFSGDVYAVSFDVHYKSNRLGSSNAAND